MFTSTDQIDTDLSNDNLNYPELISHLTIDQENLDQYSMNADKERDPPYLRESDRGIMKEKVTELSDLQCIMIRGFSSSNANTIHFKVTLAVSLMLCSGSWLMVLLATTNLLSMLFISPESHHAVLMAEGTVTTKITMNG